VDVRRGLSARGFLRCVIWAHVLAAASCALLSHFDIERMYTGLPCLVTLILMPFALLSLFACPVLVLGALWIGRLPAQQWLLAILAEILITNGQLFVMLPMVQ
jgi:hypothetical protein